MLRFTSLYKTPSMWIPVICPHADDLLICENRLKRS